MSGFLFTLYHFCNYLQDRCGISLRKEVFIWADTKIIDLLKMEKYGSLDYRELNLGGISNPNVYNEKYSPNTEHKLSFNSSSIEYAGDFELIVNMPLYSIYRNSAPLRKVFK